MVAEAEAIKVMPGAQSDFVSCQAMYPGLFSGTGGGKTVASVIKAWLYIERNPKAVGCLAGPTFPMLRQGLMEVWWDLFGSQENKSWFFKAAVMEIHFLSGAKIYLKTLDDPGKLRGMTLAFAGLDEVAEGSHWPAWKIMVARLRQKNHHPQMWVTTTPNWREQWIRKLWVENVHPQSGDPVSGEDYKAFFALTKDNVYLPKGRYESLLRDYSNTREAEQELEGKFIQVEGAAFPNFRESTHVRMPSLETMWGRKIVGVDFGGTSPTALVEVAQDENGRLWALREFYKRDCTDQEWTSVAAAWGAARIICDPSGGIKKMARLTQLYGLKMTGARFKGFKERVTRVDSRLARAGDGSPGLFIHPSCVNLINEIKNLAYHKPKGADEPLDEWAPGTADHAYDALAYAIMDFDAYHGPPPRIPVTVSGWSY